MTLSEELNYNLILCKLWKQSERDVKIIIMKHKSNNNNNWYIKKTESSMIFKAETSILNYKQTNKNFGKENKGFI